LGLKSFSGVTGSPDTVIFPSVYSLSGVILLNRYSPDLSKSTSTVYLSAGAITTESTNSSFSKEPMSEPINLILAFGKTLNLGLTKKLKLMI